MARLLHALEVDGYTQPTPHMEEPPARSDLPWWPTVYLFLLLFVFPFFLFLCLSYDIVLVFSYNLSLYLLYSCPYP